MSYENRVELANEYAYVFIAIGAFITIALLLFYHYMSPETSEITEVMTYIGRVIGRIRSFKDEVIHCVSRSYKAMSRSISAHSTAYAIILAGIVISVSIAGPSDRSKESISQIFPADKVELCSMVRR